MYAQLGNILFTPVKGFTDVSTTSETNLVEHALIDGKPKLQRVGQNLDTMDISIRFDIAFCNPQSEIDALNNSRAIGEIMPLVMGSGRFVGNYVIKSLERTHTNEAGDGTLLQAEVSVSLLEYANDQINKSVSTNAIAQAFATVRNAPQTFSELTAYKSVEQLTSAGVVASQASMSTAGATMSTLGTASDLYRPKAKAIIRDMELAGRTLDEVLSNINSDMTSPLYSMTRNLAVAIVDSQSLIQDVVVEAQALVSDIDNGNTSEIPGRVGSIVSRSIEINSRSKQLAQSAAELVTYIATH